MPHGHIPASMPVKNNWKQCEQLHVYQKQQVSCEHHTCRVVIQPILLILLSITLQVYTIINFTESTEKKLRTWLQACKKLL